jgi:hypothetical protein
MVAPRALTDLLGISRLTQRYTLCNSPVVASKGRASGVKTRWGPVALACALVTQPGCHEWVLVAPLDATKLSCAVSLPEGANVESVRKVQVKRLDGTTAELEGDETVRVVLRTPASRTMASPTCPRTTRYRTRA